MIIIYTGEIKAKRRANGRGFDIEYEKKYIKDMVNAIGNPNYQTDIMKSKFLLYKYNINIVVASGVAVMDKIYDSVKIISEINKEIFNSSSIDYYTCILYDFDANLLGSDFIDKSLQVTIGRCKISSNFTIHMNSSESYWDCEIIPLADYDTDEVIGLTID